MITHNQAVRLLAFAAAYDQRTVGEYDIQAWEMASGPGRWSYETAQRVIVEHYAAGADGPRITPAMVTDRLRTLRRRAAESFEMPRIPPGLLDSDYPEWLRRQLGVHIRAQIDHWAASGEEPTAALPSSPTSNQLGQRRVAELTAGAFQKIPEDHPADRADPEGAARRAAFAAPCGFCGAKQHEPCTRKTPAGAVRRATPHPTRGKESPAA